MSQARRLNKRTAEEQGEFVVKRSDGGYDAWNHTVYHPDLESAYDEATFNSRDEANRYVEEYWDSQGVDMVDVETEVDQNGNVRVKTCDAEGAPSVIWVHDKSSSQSKSARGVEGARGGRGGRQFAAKAKDGGQTARKQTGPPGGGAGKLERKHVVKRADADYGEYEPDLESATIVSTLPGRAAANRHVGSYWRREGIDPEYWGDSYLESYDSSGCLKVKTIDAEGSTTVIWAEEVNSRPEWKPSRARQPLQTARKSSSGPRPQLALKRSGPP